MKHMLIVAALFTAACSEPDDMPKTVDLIVHVGTLFDSVDGHIQSNKTLIIDGGRIQDIIDREAFSDHNNARQIIDASDKFVMPGLIDTHTHVTAFVESFSEDESGALQINVFTDMDYSKWHLRAMLYQGITSIRELGGFTENALQLRTQIGSGEIQGPHMRVASKLLTETPLIFPNIAREIVSEEDARAYVREMAALGVDTIKLLFNLRPEFARAAIEEAHKEGLLVAGHIRATTWRQALDLGVDSLVHTPFGNPPMADLESDHVTEVLHDMAAAGVANDPTMVMRYSDYADPAILKNTQSPEVYASAPEGLKANWQMLQDIVDSMFQPRPEMAAYHNDYVRRAFDAGVRLSTSTDTWINWADYGNALHQEMALISKAGIPNADVLIMATKNGAYQMRADSEFGTIEVGKVADLLILNKSPLDDIANSRTINAVIKDGKVVDREELLK